jgi:hypothetical protein
VSKEIIDISKSTSERPYLHLSPIVKLLLDHGNIVADTSHIEKQARLGIPASDGFYGTQGGWVCDLGKPIDFDLVRKMFELPEYVSLNEETGSIFCRTSWIEITGRVAT